MRIFIAGATGVIGIPLVKLLVAGGHDVAGMTRSPTKAETLRALGAEPVVCDVYDAAELTDAVTRFRPELVMHQLTDLPDTLEELPAYLERNSRIRSEGTRNLLDAAEAASAPRFMAQSVAWELPGEAGRAVQEHESAVLGAGGVVLRYGMFYGPGTFGGDEPPPHPRIHVEEAARRTIAAMDLRGTIVTIVEDEEGSAKATS
jgi:nucleoside-diphosphate-sugar epimerase